MYIKSISTPHNGNQVVITLAISYIESQIEWLHNIRFLLVMGWDFSFYY